MRLLTYAVEPLRISSFKCAHCTYYFMHVSAFSYNGWQPRALYIVHVIGSPKAGLSNIMDKISGGPKKKMSVLDKTALDWKNFKDKEGISEELATFNKGKGGYLEKQKFLQQTDYRQYEAERDMRLGKRWLLPILSELWFVSSPFISRVLIGSLVMVHMIDMHYDELPLQFPKIVVTSLRYCLTQCMSFCKPLHNTLLPSCLRLHRGKIGLSLVLSNHLYHRFCALTCCIMIMLTRNFLPFWCFRVDRRICVRSGLLRSSFMKAAS